MQAVVIVIAVLSVSTYLISPSTTCIRSGQRLPQLTVQALQITFSSDFVGIALSTACAIRLKGNVNALLAIARPPIAVVFTKPRRLTSAANTASGIFVFIMAHSSLLTIDSSNKPYCVIISIADRYIGLYTSNNLKIKEIGRFSLKVVLLVSEE